MNAVIDFDRLVSLWLLLQSVATVVYIDSSNQRQPKGAP